MAYDGGQRPSEIAAVFNAALAGFEDELRCFQVTRVLGSMLVFDFGVPRAKTTTRGSPVLVGSAFLSIGNAYWWVSGSHRRLNSATLDEDLAPVLREAFLGEKLCAVETNAKALRFVFTGGRSLNLDLSNFWDQDADEEVCSLHRDGLSVVLSPNRRISLRPDRRYKQAA
ncbi:hypothetical protein [uncultured Brevundimonas sp.]|uniref:hypothetical protein n=1 Tax=uncultured Brevundimonas sp. TaxID=213418 RepID=UPI00260395BA|nr:hypothetical protein [uncultured Brevundimonas sp.]